MANNYVGIESKTLIRFATVEEIEDNLDTASPKGISTNRFGRRIKVRLIEDSSTLVSEDLPWVFPLLPKHLQITPKVGETVMVFLQNIDGYLGNRFFIGPIISQDYYLNHGGEYTAMSLLQGTGTQPLCHPKANPANDGTYPDCDTIAIQGRGDAAMWLKEEELRLMCGHKPNWSSFPTVDRADPGSLEFNKRDLAYIQLRYGNFMDGDGKEFKSVANVVADRINLVTHNGAEKESYLNVTDSKDLMTDDSIQKFASEGERMVYGDSLINFLKCFRKVFENHTHQWSHDRQVRMSTDEANFWDVDLEKELLCNTIRIA